MEKISANYYKTNNERLVFIDGNLCDTIDKCYKTLVQQLSLPDYFGFNLDALDEVLSDLEWIAEDRVRIIILNLGELLKNDSERKADFLDVLSNAANDKIRLTTLGNN